MFQSSGPPPVPLVLHAVWEDADGSGGDQHFRFGVNVNICTFWADQTYFISTTRQEQLRKQPSKQTPEALRRIFCTPYHLKLLPRTENNESQKWAEMDWMLSECFSDSALGESRTTWPAECKAELLTDQNEERKKNPKDFDILTLFLSVKKTFLRSIKMQREWTNIVLCKLFQIASNTSDMTALPSILNWNVYVFSSFYHIYMLVYLICLFRHRMLSNSCHVTFVTLLNESGCLYTLTRDVFKGHVTLATSWMWPLCANDKKNQQKKMIFFTL